MKQSRKYLSIRQAISLTLCWAMLAMVTIYTTGCNIDQVVETLQVADSVAQKAIPIISPANPAVATQITRVDSDIQLVVRVYEAYETAAPRDKPSKAELIRATAGAIQNNLHDILAAVGVKNPELVSYVQVAVAVVNSALEVVLQKLPPPPIVQAPRQAESRTQTPPLPRIDNAKSPGDLKKAWNDAVKLAYPQAVVK